ncbi:MAG: aldehyde ferredoxin oxidoreductase C-terminal domain-containing protein [Candidatus Caldatribacteriota bacterium]|nr:aldehyde ferredoxin oxidoreductase C-terminal domain-containing protein [Candidatus Caldatribacteriota bacterium]
MFEKKENNKKILASCELIPGKVEKGYTDKRLYINLSENKIESKSIDPQIKDIFTGGRGYGMRYLFNAVSSDTKWNDPKNEIIFSTGPICGVTQYSGTGKTHVISLSPETGSANDNNVGGYFAPFLKFSGWDLLEIQGKAEKDVVIFIDGNKGEVTISESPEMNIDTYHFIDKLNEIYADDEKDSKNISIVSSGKGADNTNLGILNISWFDLRRKKLRIKQAGRGGTGTVFRDKKIAAIVIKYKGINANSNNMANPELVSKAGRRLTKEILSLDHLQNGMRETGTVNLLDHMQSHDCLPVHNYKFGSHTDAFKVENKVWLKRITQNQPGDSCWLGCIMRCAHAADDFELSTGPLKGEKVLVDGPEYETAAGFGGNCGCFDPDLVLEANFYCDNYGMDTIGVSTTIAFIMECYENNIINKEITGGLELNFGNSKAVLELIHQMAGKIGFGQIAGLGIRQAKKILIEKYGADEKFLQDIGMECKGMEFSEYVTKESLAQQGGYGMANKGPQHDENWLIFMDQVNNQIPTFEDKAAAIRYFSLFRTWFSLVGLCKLPWNDIEPADNKKKYHGLQAAKVPEHLENYCWLFEGVTGKHVTPEELILQSERVHNLQRVFNLKMGFGTREDDAIPYRAMGPVTAEEYESRQERFDKQLKELVGYNPKGKTTEEKLKTLRTYREDQYQKLCDAVYDRRGWDSNGVPTLKTIKKLNIDFPEIVELIKNTN